MPNQALSTIRDRIMRYAPSNRWERIFDATRVRPRVGLRIPWQAALAGAASLLCSSDSYMTMFRHVSDVSRAIIRSKVDAPGVSCG